MKDMSLNSSQLLVPNYQLRDRFQGAVLGIMLSPSALFHALIRAESSAIIDECMAQATFVQTTKNMSVWLTLVPKLLRYHDRRPTDRHLMLLEENPLSNAQVMLDSPVMAQQMILSDVLAWVLKSAGDRTGFAANRSGLNLRSLVDEISQDNVDEVLRQSKPKPQKPEPQKPEKYALVPELSSLYRHYYGLWTEVLSKLVRSSLAQPVEERGLSSCWLLRHPVMLTSAEKLTHQCVLEGILSTLPQLSGRGHSSYGQLVAIAANAALKKDLHLSRSAASSVPLDDSASLSQVSLLCGLLSGAALGRSGLPVLWQRNASLASGSPENESPENELLENKPPENEPLRFEDGISLADRCFNQWVGALI